MPTKGSKKKTPATRLKPAAAGKRVATAKPSTAGKRVEFSPNPQIRRALEMTARRRKVPKSVLIAESLAQTFGLTKNS